MDPGLGPQIIKCRFEECEQQVGAMNPNSKLVRLNAKSRVQ